MNGITKCKKYGQTYISFTRRYGFIKVYTIVFLCLKPFKSFETKNDFLEKVFTASERSANVCSTDVIMNPPPFYVYFYSTRFSEKNE